MKRIHFLGTDAFPAATNLRLEPRGCRAEESDGLGEPGAQEPPDAEAADVRVAPLRRLAKHRWSGSIAVSKPEEVAVTFRKTPVRAHPERRSGRQHRAREQTRHHVLKMIT